MANNDFSSAGFHAARTLAESSAERMRRVALDADLAAVGEPTVGMAALGRPRITSDEQWTLAMFVLDAVERAGLADAFRTCLVGDALMVGRPDVLAALGATLSDSDGKLLPLTEQQRRELRALHGEGRVGHDVATGVTIRDRRNAVTLDGRPIRRLADPNGTAAELSRRMVNRLAHDAEQRDNDTPTKKGRA